jgi:hypothetical protein
MKVAQLSRAGGPFEKVNEACDRMISNKVRFRVELKM